MDSQALPKVCIIGAGISGLHAAHLLSKNSFDIQIFEAKSKIGGRVQRSENFISVPIDIGAQFIHGKKSPHYDLVQEAGVSVTEQGTLKTLVYYEGKMRDYNEVCKKRKCGYLEQWEEDWEEEYEDNKKSDDISIQDFLKDKDYTKNLEHFLIANIDNEWATSRDKISIKGAIHFNQVFQEFGFEEFMLDSKSHSEIIAEKYKEVIGKVELNTPITKIKLNENNKVTVIAKDGASYEADFVMVAIPIIMIQKQVITFEPELPQEQLQAINNIETGTSMRILLKFSRPFWDEETLFIVIQGLVKSFWVAGIGPMNKEKHCVLVGSASGEDLIKIRELGEQKAIEMILLDLKKSFGEDVDKEFEKGVIYDWGMEEYIESAYTYPGMKEIPGKTRDQARKCVGNRVFFVGEWASGSGKYSNIGAAMESSEIVVKDIVNLYEKM